MDELEQLKKENEELKKEIERLKSFKINQKKGMIKKASQGNLMARPAFGYKISEGKLIPAENSKEIEDIFEEFTNQDIKIKCIRFSHNDRT